MFTQVWRLSGLIGSEAGHLELRSGRLIYKPIDERFAGFDVPITKVTNIKFPWHYFGGGFKLRIDGQEFRFSFVEPHNELADLTGGREVGKAWKAILLGDT